MFITSRHIFRRAFKWQVEHGFLKFSSANNDLGLVNSRHNSGKFWKIRRERFLSNILGLVSQGKVGEADEVFAAMISKHKVKPNIVLYNALIKGHAASGDVKSCFRLFNDLKKRGLIPSDRTYSSMFGACARAGSAGSDVLDKLIDEIERRELTLNTQSFNSQLSALVHCGKDPDTIFELYSSCAPESSVETFGTLLLAASRDYIQGLERSVMIWNELVKTVVANVYCYNNLLLCIRTGGITDNMLQSCGDGASGVGEVSLKLSSSSNVPINVNFFISRNRVRSLCRDGLSNLLVAMESDKVKPDIRTLSILNTLLPDFTEIRRLSEKFKIHLDDQILSANKLKIVDTNVKFKGNTKISCSVTASSGDVDIAQAFESIKDSKDWLLWRDLLSLCVRHRDYKTAVQILKRMKYNEVFISEEVLIILEKMANNPPKKPWLQKSFNGFKGYYKLWCKSL